MEKRNDYLLKEGKGLSKIKLRWEKWNKYENQMELLLRWEIGDPSKLLNQNDSFSNMSFKFESLYLFLSFKKSKWKALFKIKLMDY
jgi:hypothetical protein